MKIKDIIFPTTADRLKFFSLSVIIFSVVSLFKLLGYSHIIPFVFFAPLYVSYVAARIKDFEDNPAWWCIVIGIIFCVLLYHALGLSLEQPFFSIIILLSIHVYLQFKKGTSQTSSYQVVENFKNGFFEDLAERSELSKLKKMKKKLERKAEIEKLRNEVDAS